MIQQFAQLLAHSIREGLPGQAAHSRVSARFRMPERYDPWPAHARKSAVLILCYPHQGQVHTVLFRRTPDNSPHSGQVAFPGGKTEPHDLDLFATALRETHEELGISPHLVSELQAITPIYIPVSNFAVQPVIGILQEAPHFHPNSTEVEEVICVSFDHLFNHENHFVGQFERQGHHFEADCIRVGRHVIWGATAIILAEVEDLYHRTLSKMQSDTTH